MDMAISKKQRILITIALLLSLMSTVLCGFTIASAQTTEPANAMEAAFESPLRSPLRIGSAEEDVAINPSLTGKHQHAWQEVTETVHHEAITHEVEHPALYEEVPANHTICNVCTEIIDGMTSEHAQATGHASYTTRVPIYQKVLVKEAWTETIVDEDAFDEETIVDEACTICSIRKSDLGNA